MLASRYNMCHLGRMPMSFGMRMLAQALEKRREEWARQEWLAHLPWMGKDNFVPFDEFYQKRVVKVPVGARRSKEELLSEARRIREAAAQGKTASTEKEQ